MNPYVYRISVGVNTHWKEGLVFQKHVAALSFSTVSRRKLCQNMDSLAYHKALVLYL